MEVTDWQCIFLFNELKTITRFFWHKRLPTTCKYLHVLEAQLCSSFQICKVLEKVSHHWCSFCLNVRCHVIAASTEQPLSLYFTHSCSLIKAEESSIASISKNITYFEKTCLVVVCNQTGMIDGHAGQAPVGFPMPPGQPDLLALIAPSSGKTKTVNEQG